MSRGYKRVEERAPDVSCGDRIFWLRLCPCENCSLLGMGVTLGSASAHEPSPQARGPQEQEGAPWDVTALTH